MALRHDMRRGVLCMLAACALFSVMSALIKLLGARVHFFEQAFFRSAFAMPVVLLIVVRAQRGRGVIGALRTKRFPGHLLRALTGTAATTCSFFALTVLPLAEHQALTNTTPIWVTLLSIPFLGEKVGIHRSSAVALGFLGILVIAFGQGAFTGGLAEAARWGVAAAVVHGVFSAATTLMVRSLSSTEPSTTIVLWQSTLMTILLGTTLPFVWVTPDLHDFLILVLIGVIGGFAQVMMTEAWASAQVSALAPYSYSSLLWAILFGWVVFADVPGITTIAGAVLIVAASLYILHREIVLGRRRA